MICCGSMSNRSVVWYSRCLGSEENFQKGDGNDEKIYGAIMSRELFTDRFTAAFVTGSLDQRSFQ